ncbi:uncharacterized protein Z520_06022 [Fonsecaea multimorphosa CBS 102226]|uniref:Acyltransferase 3 domain-containing protein n=1 Tax=Fonsecaea multimorphosa CBS 102226 TaxID=1442371 RepID=A0A0D2K440_9EURO|nr:uncharacterized protein Z520_06022 [Fonsecaea multimorphosa CBS 102226]KIX97944.1 hypothetical protein Z520_06022 [Fonsecaea multimorphosa CBS 102226]OAL24318.1 hypothetical protein AYO22_05694 [Fonsecaea multimorphosa]
MATFESLAEPSYDKHSSDGNVETWSPALSRDGTLHEEHDDLDLHLPEIRRSRLATLHRAAMAVFVILPSPLMALVGNNYPSTNTKDFGSTTYLLGLRGMASFFVFIEHFAMRSYSDLIREYDQPTFLQLPGIRLIYSGPAWVKMFFILSGFALSVTPIEIMYERDWDRLFHTVASAFFRRGFRIFIPTIVAALFVMIGVRLRLYEVSNVFAASVGLGYPIRRHTLIEQFADLVEYLLGIIIYPWGWLKPLSNITRSVYSATFWTIPREYWSSLQIFALTIALSRLKPSARIFTLVNMVLYAGWANRGDLSCFLVGMLFAEFHIRKKLFGASQNNNIDMGGRSAAFKIIRSGLWTLVLVSGIWLASIPIAQGDYGSSTPGYRTISKIIPLNDNVMSIGMALMLLGIYKLPLLQAFFSSSLMCYLGDISFSLYLIHWPILAAGAWNMVPVMQTVTRGQKEVGFLLALMITTPLMLWASDLFWRLVDLPSIRFAKRLEKQLIVS